MKIPSLLLLTALVTWCFTFTANSAEKLPEIPELQSYIFAPQSTPEWLKGHEELLPPVDPAIVKEMALLMNYWIFYVDHEGGVPFTSPQYETDGLKALRRIAELREQASNAMLWLYTFEQADNPGRADKQKSILLQYLARDPDLTVQMLPLLRQQVAWWTEKYQTKPIDPKYYSDPISQIIGYFLKWGDENDVEALRQMLKLLQENAQDTYGGRENSKDWIALLNSEFEGPLANSAKKARLNDPRPVWEFLAFGWNHRRDIGLPEPTDPPTPPSAQMKPTAPKAVLVPSVAKVQVPEPQDQSWIFWLLAVFAALGGMYWLMKKRMK